MEGIVTAVYNMGKATHTISEPDHVVSDGLYHVIRFTRSGANATLQVDDWPRRHRNPTGAGTDNAAFKVLTNLMHHQVFVTYYLYPRIVEVWCKYCCQPCQFNISLSI